MSIKSQLCNVVITLKDELKLTYDDILVLGEGSFHKSQLTSIINHEGVNVSVDVIEKVIQVLGGELSIICTTDPTLESFE